MACRRTTTDACLQLGRESEAMVVGGCKHTRHVTACALLCAENRYQRAVCLLLFSEELPNMEWNFLVQMKGRMQVITKEELVQGWNISRMDLNLSDWEKMSDEGQGQLLLEIR